jgi:hypothetical protein
MVLKVPKKKVAEEEIIKETIRSLKEIYSAAVDLENLENRIIEIEEKELASSNRYNNYRKWVEHEFKIEVKMRDLTKKVLEFFRELKSIEESMEKSTERLYSFTAYSKFKNEYGKRLWGLIKNVDWLKPGLVHELGEAEEIIPEEKRWAGIFPELAPQLTIKYNTLYIEAAKLGIIIANLNHVKGDLERENQVLES